MRKFIISEEYLEQLCAALEINCQTVTRIIIDAKADEPIYAYVEILGTEDILKFSPTTVTKATIGE
jgi:hypothetical protein